MARQPLTVLRKNPRTGQPDDLVVDCDMVHLEKEDSGVWFLAIYRGNRRIALRFRSAVGIRMFVDEDELGLIDDTLG